MSRFKRIKIILSNLFYLRLLFFFELKIFFSHFFSHIDYPMPVKNYVDEDDKNEEQTTPFMKFHPKVFRCFKECELFNMMHAMRIKEAQDEATYSRNDKRNKSY